MPTIARTSSARLIAGLAFAVLAATDIAAASDANPPPVAARKPSVSTHHGVKLSDDYAWMRTAKPEAILTRPELLEAPIRRHLDAEKRYAERMLAPNAALVAKMVQEMRGRASVEGDAVPEPNGPYAYSSRFAPGAERKLHVRTPRNGGPEEILLDENALAKGRRNFTLDETSISTDHKRLAYTFDVDGSERHTLKVRDLSTGRDLPDTIPDVRGAPVWSNDGRFLFYVKRDPTKWARTILRHKLGTTVAKDVRVYEEKEEGFSVGITTSLSNRFMGVELSDFSTAQMGFVDLDAPETPLRLMTPRIAGVKFAISDLGDRLIVASNADGAKTWKIGARAIAGPADAALETIIAARPERLIQSVIVFKDHLVRLERDLARGQQEIVIRRWSDGAEHTIAFDEGPAKIEILSGEEQDTRTVRFTYETMAQPRQTFDYDMETRARTLRKVRDVPSGHDAQAYVTRRTEATAADGTKIPVSLLYAKSTPLDGSAPVWLLGYGSYGDVEQPEFVAGRLSLVDRGFIYAIAHVRGGGDRGDAWHEAGRLRKKTTTFTDFIAVTEHLIAERFTSKGRVVAYGASAGGTLVGAVANMRPDLFGAIIAEVPFVDVVNTMLDRNLPLTESGFSEFGNPIDSAEDFAAMRAYSPYDNVKAQAYPPILVEQALNDTRVPYWEAAKWVAKLRQVKTGNAPVILWMKDAGGHSGGGGRYDGLADIARVYAFALTAVGLGG